MYMIVNSTNQSLSITQGSGANVTIAATKSAIVLADGAGSGAAVTDFTAVLGALTELDGITAGTVTASKAVVVDSNKDITGFRNVTMTGELDAATLDISGDADIDGTTNLDIVDIDGAVNIAAATTIATNNKIQFRDTAIYIQSSADGQLDIVADTEVQIAATTIDINGAVALNGAITGATNITLSGELDAATLDISGNADIDGTLETDALSLNGTAVTSTAAELNKLDAITRGSIIYGNSSGATARLSKGGANTVLTSNGTDISWAAAVIGVGQSWRADTERTANTFFQNNSPSAIMVQAYTTSGPTMDVGPSTDDTVPIAQSDRDGDFDNPMYVIVPAYHYWRVSGVDHVSSSNRQNILD
jgi:cytoskeletal protein CcmA (bactofilin family)